MERDWAILNIDKQRMWAGLTIKEPEGEECPYFSPEFIEEYLRENGINVGLDREAIRALADRAEYGREIIVAKGKPPVHGRDGFFRYTVLLEDVKSKPVVNSDGSVDYYNSLKLAMVNEGDLIAVYVPPTSGEYGYTIFSEMIHPIKGREQRALRGKGFTVSEDGKEYRAAFGGRIYRENDRIIINRIYIVRGDLDIEKGNISFNGDVEVMGDVRSGLCIEAGGDIFIHGHVGSCQLKAGGSITVKKGIQGRNKCFIWADGIVACSFVERCCITAGDNIYADSILDSEVSAGQRVIVSGRKGLVLGGCISGTQGVKVKDAGNEAGTITILQAGIVKEALNRVSELVELHHKVTQEVELLDKNLKIYDSLDGSRRTKETEAVRVKILRAKIIKAAEQKKLSEELGILNEEINRAKKDACVRITGVAYDGIRVNMGKSWYEMKEACRDVEFRLHGNEVVMLAGENE